MRGLHLGDIVLPPGFSITVYADNVEDARSLALGDNGTLFVGTRSAGKVYEVFAIGWLQNGSAWGRPVDVLVMPDGALLVSDNRAGVIYRISYKWLMIGDGWLSIEDWWIRKNWIH
jgi:hypothetical protein